MELICFSNSNDISGSENWKMALILKDGRCPLVDPSGLPQTSPPASLKCGWSFELSFVVKKQLVGFGQFDGFCKCILMD